ncbi:uncharacterized protein LOC129456835 [Periophthalmus magnuspinnatus]|uniref:uncharacterized protein LOC129456835 n=1 Tax=Periophthalmus magnuspinnatus TaxID=409849 RepID=UPI002436335F|nr:uncharacterized protein LOC129456835 [Periophthalmus magnuspinnatus]
MDNCDLAKLSVSVGKLHPDFSPNITKYQVTVESSVNKVNLNVATSDCGASYRIRFGDESRVVKLSDGLNKVEIEVAAEDGTIKKYYVEITKLPASIAELSELALEGEFPLYPEFNPKTFEYNSTVPFYVNSVTMIPKVPDKHIQVKVNGVDSSQPVLLNYGDTLVDILVCSADGSHSQVYTVLVTRELLPLAVTFSDPKNQFEYECPVSLNAFYRPISINESNPKHIFSRPYIEMLARRSKVDPLNNSPLRGCWKIIEMSLDHAMSAAPVKCLFRYRGCDSEIKLSELGSHLLDCPHKPTGELRTKDVTDTKWYKEHFETTSSLSIETKHSVEVRNWEKKLRLRAAVESSVENLCAFAEDHLKVYNEYLPKPGDLMQYSEDTSPLYNLEQAAVYYASAIRYNSKDSRLHFLLGMVLEKTYYATEMYGLQKKIDKENSVLSNAKSTSYQDDILAVCKLHGLSGTPTVEKQLQALGKEYQSLRDQGQSSKADYVQTLYLWLSKKPGKDNSVALQDEENCLKQALMKYLDAWSLSPHCWEYNLHVGRLLLLQGKHTEALQHLQTGLALRPLNAGLRFFTGLALLQQEKKPSEDSEMEAALFLQQGLEHFVGQRCRESWKEQFPLDPLSSISTQFLQGLLTLGRLQQRNILQDKAISSEQVYHIVAALAAQSVSQCVIRGEASSQLEWVLLDAHSVLLQRLIHKDEAKAELKPLVAKRCQAIIALIHLTSITPCQELLDLQENACQLSVVTTPRNSYALCQLGLAQLSQYDSSPKLTTSQDVLANACLSFQASIDLEGKPQKGEPPEQLSKQKWWQDKQKSEQEIVSKTAPSQPQAVKGPANTGATRARGRAQPGKGLSKTPAPVNPGRAGRTASASKPSTARGRPGVAARSSSSSTKRHNTSSKSKQEVPAKPIDTVPEPVKESVIESGPVNPKSYIPRIGLAGALSRSKKYEQAKTLYQEVISMSPEVHDAYIELVQLLEPTDPEAALEVYCRYPLKPVAEQTLYDAFITGETVRILMKLELYDHPMLGSSLVAYGKVMGLSCIEKYIDILDGKSMTKLLRSVYAKIHDRPENDPELQDFFRFKCWL